MVIYLNFISYNDFHEICTCSSSLCALRDPNYLVAFFLSLSFLSQVRHVVTVDCIVTVIFSDDPPRLLVQQPEMDKTCPLTFVGLLLQCLDNSDKFEKMEDNTNGRWPTLLSLDMNKIYFLVRTFWQKILRVSLMRKT